MTIFSEKFFTVQNFFLFFVLITFTGILISVNLFSNDGHTALYRCYGKQFLFGINENHPQSNICVSLTQKGGYYPNFQLPVEYPLLSVIPFFLPLPSDNHYDIAFAIEISIIVGFLCVVMKKQRDLKHVYLLLLYLILGNLFTLGNRYDLIPALLVILCLIAADKKHYTKSYVLLGIASMFKFYSLPLVAPLILAEQISSNNLGKRNFKGIISFCATLSFIFFLTFMIAPRYWYDPILYMINRPVETESIPASIAFIFSIIQNSDLCIIRNFGSINISGLSYDYCNTIFPIKISLGLSILFDFVGLALILRSLWRKRINLGQSFIGIILLFIVTSKIFSPQFLLWVTPLIIYVYGLNRFWLFFWGIICILTTFIYPILFDVIYFPKIVDFYPVLWSVVAVRNGLAILLTVTIIFPFFGAKIDYLTRFLSHSIIKK